MSVWIDKKYLNLVSVQLERFVWKGNGCANHRCPICGDSKKNKLKARGYHYIKKGGLFYNCKNCGASMSTGNFIKRINPELHKEYVMERFKNGENKYSNYQKPTSEDLGFTKPVFDIPAPEEQCLLDEMLDRVDKLPTDHIARKYVAMRKIPEDKWQYLYYIDDTQLLGNISPRQKDMYTTHEPRLILPFYHQVTQQFVGCTARALLFNKDTEKFYDDERIKRYLAIRIHPDDPLIFNIDKVDQTKKIYVTEGPVDSLFLPNAVAVGNTNLSAAGRYLDKDKLVLIYDYQPRNKELVKIIRKSIDSGFAVCMLPSDFPGKDINAAVMNGTSLTEVQNIIDNNTYKGLEAVLKFSVWAKV